MSKESTCRSACLRAAICAALAATWQYCPAQNTGADVPSENGQRDGYRIQIIEFEEQYGDVSPKTAERPWRSVLCVEVVNRVSDKPRRVWQRISSGRMNRESKRVYSDATNSQTSPVLLSAPHSGRCLLVICGERSVSAGLIDLNSVVAPPPNDRLRDNSAELNYLLIPEPYSVPGDPDTKLLKELGKSELGTELGPHGRIWIKAPIKTSTGWRVDGTAYSTFDQRTQDSRQKAIRAIVKSC
jgi:hypothetical protein